MFSTDIFVDVQCMVILWCVALAAFLTFGK